MNFDLTSLQPQPQINLNLNINLNPTLTSIQYGCDIKATQSCYNIDGDYQTKFCLFNKKLNCHCLLRKHIRWRNASPINILKDFLSNNQDNSKIFLAAIAAL